jgi:hypothetical protein
VAEDKTHRGHAVIEQIHTDLKNSALAHLASGKFTANAAWLVLRATGRRHLTTQPKTSRCGCITRTHRRAASGRLELEHRIGAWREVAASDAGNRPPAPKGPGTNRPLRRAPSSTSRGIGANEGALTGR